MNRHILLLVVAASGICFGWILTFRLGAPGLDRGLVPSEEDLCFGEIWYQNNFKHVVRFRNDSAEPVEVKTISTGCVCTNAKLRQSGPVMPGGTAEIELTIDLSSRKFNDNGEFETYLLPVLESGALNNRWTLRGKILFPIEFDEKAVLLGVFDSFREHPPVSVPFRISRGVNAVQVKCDCEYLSAQILDPGIAPQDRILVVTPKMSEESLEINDDVVLTATLESGQVLDPISLRVLGSGAPRVDVTPRRLTLGAIRIGRKVSREISVYSRDGAVFAVNGIEATPAAVHAELEEQSQLASTKKLVLHLTPTILGATSAKVGLSLSVGEARTKLVFPVWIDFYGVEEP